MADRPLIPAAAGHVVAMCEHRGVIYIACRFAVYEYRDMHGSNPIAPQLKEILIVPHQHQEMGHGG